MIVLFAVLLFVDVRLFCGLLLVLLCDIDCVVLFYWLFDLECV